MSAYCRSIHNYCTANLSLTRALSWWSNPVNPIIANVKNIRSVGMFPSFPNYCIHCLIIFLNIINISFLFVILKLSLIFHLIKVKHFPSINKTLIVVFFAWTGRILCLNLDLHFLLTQVVHVLFH